MTTLLKKNHARSGPAIWYRARADLRGRRLPAGSVVLVVALATLLIGLALAVFGSVQAPFDRLFTQLNGAHLWVYYPSAPTQGQLDAIIHAPNVAASTELEEGINNGAVIVSSKRFDADLRSFPTRQPTIGQLLITQGQALAAGDSDGVIVNQAFADAQHLQVGDQLSIVTPQGLAYVHVRGLSVDVNHHSGGDITYCHAYLLRSTLERLFPTKWLHEIIGLRLVDPYALGQTSQTILQRLQAQGYTDNSLWDEDWLEFRDDFGKFSLLTGTLLLAFGIVGLVAAGVIIANLVIGQVLAQRRELGILKAVGFTPLQVVRTLVLEYLLLGLLGAVVGLALMAAIASPLLAALGASVGVPVPPHYDLVTGALVLGAILLFIAFCAALPAWRAGRTRVADAIRPGGAVPGRGRARLAGLMFTIGLPVVAALGVRGVTARPLRTLLVSLTLLLGVLTSVFALGYAATLDKYDHDPALSGVFADMNIYPGLYDAQATQQLVKSRPEIAYYYSSFERAAQLSSGNTFAVIFTSGDTQRATATISSGRWFNERANELVLGKAALDHLGVYVGERLPLSIHLGNGEVGQQVTITYTVVGSLYATQQTDQGYAPLSSLLAHITIPPDQLLANTGYEVTLRPGISPQAFAQSMQVLTAGRLRTNVYDTTAPAGITQGFEVMVLLSIALMFVAGVSVLNAMTLSTRERYRELATLRAIGLTPRQLLGSVINGAVVLGALAILVGIPLGLWLTTLVAQSLVSSVGGPANLQVAVNLPGLGFLIPVTLLVAALGAYVPARWAARVPAAEVLRYE